MNANNNFIEAIYIAAMLHDIGKFYQRADGCSVNNSTLCAEIKALENIYCPVYNNKTTHKHVLWTAQFFKNFEQHLNNLPFLTGLSVDKLMRWAAIHHNPSGNESIELIIQKADHYSSAPTEANRKPHGKTPKRNKIGTALKMSVCGAFLKRLA